MIDSLLDWSINNLLLVFDKMREILGLDLFLVLVSNLLLLRISAFGV